ncbi:MAG: hypothetical protein IH899_17330, partial [Planctomycetes bacterium]|nr:hypothetical protein [Planctomycetota bacterium]
PSVTWLTRVHPGEKIDGSLFSSDDLIRKYFPELPVHIKVLWSDSTVNSYSIYQLIDVGITIFGTVGVELPFFGRPILVAGRAHFAGKGFSYDARDREHYFSLLKIIHFLKNGKVFLYLADCLEDRILLRVSWRVRPLIEVTPSSLYLDSGKPGEIRTGMIVISARRGDHLQVSQLLLAENSLQEEMESERLTNHSVRLKLKITFPSEPGIFQSHLALRCTSPVDKIIRVPVSGFVNIK